MEFKDLKLFLEREPSRSVNALLPALTQLESGHIHMTRELLLQVGDSFWAFIGGEHYGSEYYLLQFGAVIEWSGAWEDCARPEWLDIFADILSHPPSRLEWNEHFVGLFFYIAGEFPEKAVNVLSSLLSDEKVHPNLVAMLRAYWYFSPEPRCSPEMLDEGARILIDSPPGWLPDADFTVQFFHLASEFPEKAVQVLAALFSDEHLHPRLQELLRDSYEEQEQ